MAEEELHVVNLRDDFYRDGINKVVWIILLLIGAGVLLFLMSLYLLMSKPQPVTFDIGKEWRVQNPVPLIDPYLTEAELLQWVSESLPKAFVYDFIHYQDQMKAVSQFFTPSGWKAFLNQLNIYANYNKVQSDKLFVNSAPAGAPIVLNNGPLEGRYAWWIEMPLNINYAGERAPVNLVLTLQILVVRVSTLNNLSGVGIENILVTSSVENR